MQVGVGLLIFSELAVRMTSIVLPSVALGVRSFTRPPQLMRKTIPHLSNYQSRQPSETSSLVAMT